MPSGKNRKKRNSLHKNQIRVFFRIRIYVEKYFKPISLNVEYIQMIHESIFTFIEQSIYAHMETTSNLKFISARFNAHHGQILIFRVNSFLRRNCEASISDILRFRYLKAHFFIIHPYEIVYNHGCVTAFKRMQIALYSYLLVFVN